MYLDNVIKSAQSASMPEITYSEIMEDTLRMVEVEGAGELALLKAEASAHILGAEAPSDWWVKIKTVARKVFEMLKNLITKVFAFIKTIPQKIGTLVTRLMTKWEKLGMKSKIERILKKTGVEVRFSAMQELKGREFGKFFDPTQSGAGHTTTNIGRAVQNLSAVIIGAAQNIAKLDPENDDYAEQKQTQLEAVEHAKGALKDEKDAFKQESWKPFDKIATGSDDTANNQAIANGLIKFMVPIWNELKNREYEKQAERSAKTFEQVTRVHASLYRLAMSGYEKAVRDEDEKAVRARLEAAKAYRLTLSTVASASATIASLHYGDALLAAKLVNACLGVFKGGNTNSTKQYV